MSWCVSGGVTERKTQGEKWDNIIVHRHADSLIFHLRIEKPILILNLPCLAFK